jgi:TolA-binding protein
MQSVRVIRLHLAALFLSTALFPVFAQEPATAGSYNSEAAALMQQAQEWESAGNSSRAIATYRSLVKNYPLAPAAPAAQFRLGELYDSLGNSKRSFDAYQKLLEGYPQSREFDRAVSAQVAIADSMAESRRYDRAAEMYQSILSAAPFASFAPEVQFKLGQAYESQKEFE